MNLFKKTGVWETLSPEDQARIRQSEMAIHRKRDAAIKQKDWARFLSMFGSTERLTAFEQVQGRMTDAEFWENLGETWIMAEFAIPDYQRWERLLFFTRPRSGASTMMTTSERHRLGALPAMLTIYRGQQDSKHPIGFSWTLSKARAKWFVEKRGTDRMRFLSGGQWTRGDGVVLRANVSKHDVLCYLNRRREREVMVHPSILRGVHTAPIG